MITDEQILASATVGARWWADRLRDGRGVGDNGATDKRSVMAGVITNMTRSLSPITPKICDGFEELLRVAMIREMVDPHGICYRDVTGFSDGGLDLRFGVDYNPDPILYSALRGAGIEAIIAERTALPWKTMMFCSARRVLVKSGYRAKRVEIHGPVWGATYEEDGRAANYRYTQLDVYLYPWLAKNPDKNSYMSEWFGCVPE